MKTILKKYGKSLAKIKDIDWIEAFEGGFFSKPPWIKKKDEEYQPIDKRKRKNHG